jgi:hypothetical protein
MADMEQGSGCLGIPTMAVFSGGSRVEVFVFLYFTYDCSSEVLSLEKVTVIRFLPPFLGTLPHPSPHGVGGGATRVEHPLHTPLHTKRPL